MSRKQSKTCIAVIKTRRGKILMAGDRRSSWDYSMSQIMPRSKVNKRDDVLLGATGDGFLCTLFVDIMEIPSIDDGIEPDTYMFYPFRKKIFNTLKEHGFVDKHAGLKIPGDVDVELVVAVLGKVYQVRIENPDIDNHNPNGFIAIDEVSLPYATGCGGLPALGVLKGKEFENGFNSRQDLDLALRVACDISPGCGLPLDIIGD